MQFRAFEIVPFRAGTLILALCVTALGRVAVAQDFPITPGNIISDGVPAPGAGYIHVSTNTDIYTFSGTAGQVIFLEEIMSFACSTVGPEKMFYRFRRP